MKTVKVPAVKKSSGKVVKAPSKQYSHDDLEAKGQRGFVLSDGTFANRGKAAVVAKKAKQALKHHNEVKHRSALILTGLSMIGLTYSLIMICLTSDIDWLIVFNVFALSSGIGLLGLRK